MFDRSSITRSPHLLGYHSLTSECPTIIRYRWRGTCNKPGERTAPHEHLYDYMFTVLERSTLAVFSGENDTRLFSFETRVGETMAFERHSALMHDVTSALQPFAAVHGVQSVGKDAYREILVESKPCAGGIDVARGVLERVDWSRVSRNVGSCLDQGEGWAAPERRSRRSCASSCMGWASASRGSRCRRAE